MCFVTPIKFCETGRLEVDLALPPSVDIRVDSEMKATTLLAYLGKSILILINVKYFFDVLIFPGFVQGETPVNPLLRRRKLKPLDPPPASSSSHAVTLSSTWTFRKFYLQLDSRQEELEQLEENLQSYYGTVRWFFSLALFNLQICTVFFRTSCT